MTTVKQIKNVKKQLQKYYIELSQSKHLENKPDAHVNISTTINHGVLIYLNITDDYDSLLKIHFEIKNNKCSLNYKEFDSYIVNNYIHSKEINNEEDFQYSMFFTKEEKEMLNVIRYYYTDIINPVYDHIKDKDGLNAFSITLGDYNEYL